MPRPTIRHGTRTCYQHGCRCFECALAQSRYKQAWQQRRARGRVMVSAAAAAAHIRYLHDVGGMGITRIARVARVDPATIDLIRKGRQRLVHAEKSARITAVTLLEDRLVDGAATWRRVRELQAVGVRLYEIGEVVRGYRERRADTSRWKRYWRAPARRGLPLNRRGRILRRNAEAIERFYVRHFHQVLRRATPEEMRSARRSVA